MWQQKSFEEKEEDIGSLYLIPTPIGNLEDMTFRAVKILKEVDVIAAEDTRQTKKLCLHFDIDTKLVSYHDHNKRGSGEKLLQTLREGRNVALVSDAGTPAISDPGYELVVDCLAEEISVIPLPGANAAITALIASGLNTQHFYYYGFLNRQKKERKKELEQLKNIQVPLIFYESPHRLEEMLKHVLEQLGDRKIAICRELTKRYEEFIRGTISEVIEWSQSSQVRGEFCVVVDGASEVLLTEDVWWENFSINEHVEHYIEEKQMSSKEAIKEVAKERQLPKRDVYAEYHK
ncbi:16S rRNA (cytidine(1402)-2'-O)-methyltransferase [Alkalihalobacterium chitinilyticum]|uniref:Ribosomal RNA small subunit methyltransferase I n=1 Tax=Alkalihalobacterium chitinilyticum TaxID=2980103 RepID=A0ABT5VLB0_9BACI|nr:16S rRNA (cytidine(1402)-2'-O)-methyltransferase [Alkalihalobacterium chitinilyticum]MDE5416011.1 16S rRNA (cytidine(1402)-2'-O)-methyltransferase [Alkalihalobacterium chitinilyticum]